MSDGALSQEEIDSLLAGLDGGSPQAAPAAAQGRQGGPGLSQQEAQAFKAILEATLSAQSQNLSMITGLTATVASPNVDGTTRDGFFRDVPEAQPTYAPITFMGSVQIWPCAGAIIFTFSMRPSPVSSSAFFKKRGVSGTIRFA